MFLTCSCLFSFPFREFFMCSYFENVYICFIVRLERKQWGKFIYVQNLAAYHSRMVYSCTSLSTKYYIHYTLATILCFGCQNLMCKVRSFTVHLYMYRKKSLMHCSYVNMIFFIYYHEE